MADIESERIEFCKQIYEKYNKALGDIDDMYNRYDIINATPDLWINGMYQYMNESERKSFYNLVEKDTFINPISRNAILSRRELFFNNTPKEYPILKHLTDEQWKVMSEIGYPYAPGNAKEQEAAPIPEMIYWRLAAGFISQEDAIRAFSTTGYTVGEDPQRTREILAELNSQYGKLDSDFNSLVSVKKPQIPNTKEELIALVGNDYKRETNFGSLFVAEIEYYGHIDHRRFAGINIHDGNIEFMGINAPKSWEKLTPAGQQKVCQWVYDNLEQTRKLPDMFYQALVVLKDADKAVGKHKEGYDMFKRLRDELFSGDVKAIPYYPYNSWAGKVSNDFRYFIPPTNLEISSHYKELADALAIMPRADIEKFIKEVENHPLRKEVCMEIEKQDSLREAKAHLMHIIESARANLGDTIKIHPTIVKVAGIDTTVKAIFLAPDGKGGGEFRLAGEDYSALAVREGDRTEFNIEKILEDSKSITALAGAVWTAHDNRPRIKTRKDIPESDIRSAEYAAKQAVRDRIVTPSARRFTPEQADTLRHYRAMFTEDTPTAELFTRLYKDVTMDSDVTRKPEKWQTDTLRELNDLAEGITRNETRGLHM